MQYAISGVIGACIRLIFSATLIVGLTASLPLHAAEAKTANFLVRAADLGTARSIALRAEELRQTIAFDWLGRELPAWSSPCLVDVDTTCARVCGETTYLVRGRCVSGWKMKLRGAEYRILDTVLPHEIVHSVLITHFRGPLPRWADEGAALLAEAEGVRRRLWLMEESRFSSGHARPLRELMEAKDYPTGVANLRHFYVQGASVTEFLASAGKQHFVAFLSAGMKDGWDAALASYYGFRNVEHLESAWGTWMADARPPLQLDPKLLLVSVPVDKAPSLAAASPGPSAE